ncbi:ER membrane protein complex subunit 4 [Teratosphaeria destructans]|uniref:ER membrane protein complex subunit 4 n=1 Tax=Teratosphaeria destructans TaxID=418781 RepID=A0A9W7SY47_9PEZI|nr:ER membrane protein complex subunit 4 [Teratosphaeria destructans]
MSQPTELPPQWLTDLHSPPPTSTKLVRPGTYADPPGFHPLSGPNTRQKPHNNNTTTTTTTTKSAARKKPTEAEMDTLKLKKAWEIALAPAKQLPMNAVGMYMTGNSLQIFSIMMVFMLFKNPVTAVLNLPATFRALESEGNRPQMVLVKLAFVGCNLLALALGVWKVNGMGLLPTTRSDWLAWEGERVPRERAVFVGG